MAKEKKASKAKVGKAVEKKKPRFLYKGTRNSLDVPVRAVFEAMVAIGKAGSEKDFLEALGTYKMSVPVEVVNAVKMNLFEGKAHKTDSMAKRSIESATCGKLPDDRKRGEKREKGGGGGSNRPVRH